MRDALSFVMGLQWADVPEPVKARVKMALLDVIGVGAGGAGFRSAQIAAGFAADHLGGNAPLLFDDRHASAAGAAFAAAMSIDALDAHDGFNPAKGHIGAVLFASLWPCMKGMRGADFLTALVAGYEFGARASMAQHGTVRLAPPVQLDRGWLRSDTPRFRCQVAGPHAMAKVEIGSKCVQFAVSAADNTFCFGRLSI